MLKRIISKNLVWLLMLCCQLATALDFVMPVEGHVVVEFVSTEAEFVNNVTVYTPIEETFCFDTEITRLGATRILGTCSQNFPLGFRLTSTSPEGTTYTWYSNPAKNSDGLEHVITTPFDATTYLLKWEDVPGLGDKDFNDIVIAVHIDGDTDGDGIWDSWETNGLDSNYDSVIELAINQSPYNAKPDHKDIFVEIDWMVDVTHDHKPKLNVVEMVINAFAEAPVSNPDKVDGITLHVDVSNEVPHQKSVHFDPKDPDVINPTTGDFDDVKKANFDDRRRYFYHYCLFAHDLGELKTYAGKGETGGNDFIVTFGGWHIGDGDIDGDGTSDEDVGTIKEQASCLMHELGHNLGLQHGGDEKMNFKPNYVSVMNYVLAFTSDIIPSIKLDYSRNVLPDLDENHLNENIGIQDASNDTVYKIYVNSEYEYHYGAGTGPIDWDWDGDQCEPDVSTDINTDNEKAILHGYNDWANIRYRFTKNGHFQDGSHEEDFPEEMTGEISDKIDDMMKKAGTQFPVGRFEIPTDWSSIQGGIQFDNSHVSEGKSSLKITKPGWKEIVSRNVNTLELLKLSNQFTADVYISKYLPNPDWIGTIALTVSIKSSSKTFNLGEISLQGKKSGQFNELSFTLPVESVNLLQEPHSDVQFKFTTNTSAQIVLDNLRFTGATFINPVRSYNPTNSGPGSSSLLAVDLRTANTQTMFSPKGKYWLKITNKPGGWNPSKVYIQFAADDNKPLTGYVEIMGNSYFLNGWTKQLEFKYDYSAPLIFDVYNLGDRPYRVTWWAGQ